MLVRDIEFIASNLQGIFYNPCALLASYTQGFPFLRIKTQLHL